jgi:hypothetical protein
MHYFDSRADIALPQVIVYSCEEDYMAEELGQGGRRYRSHPGATGAASGAYGLAFIGAAVYYVGHAATFGAGIVGFIKALLWPAFVVYALMKHMGM